MFHNTVVMNGISEEVREKLISRGYASRANLPNVRDTTDWDMIRDDCKLSHPQLIKLKNALWPVPSLTGISLFSMFTNSYFCYLYSDRGYSNGGVRTEITANWRPII
jgi:hypothetical protein